MNHKQALQIVNNYTGCKLLPCPFCGECEAKPMLTWTKRVGTTDISFVIQCTNCGCEPSDCADVPEHAITFWNTRGKMPVNESALIGFECARKLIKKLVDGMDDPFKDQ